MVPMAAITPAEAQAYFKRWVEIGLPEDRPLKLDAAAVPAQVPDLNARMTDLMAQAARQRPDLAAALAERDAAEANFTVARSVGRPSLLITTAGDNQQVALGRYQSGVGTIIDVLTAQSSAASARLLRIGAEFGWQVARAQLALALGRLSGADPLNDPAAP